MGAFERLQNYSSGLGSGNSAKNCNTDKDASIAYIDNFYKASTPLGYFLQKLHQLGYLIVEPVFKSKGEDVISESEYNNLEDDVKSEYTPDYAFTEFANMLLSDGDNLVIAGAGSGKTTALVFKIMKDVLTGESTKVVEAGGSKVRVVDDIFVGTFLKSGADELKESVAKWQRKLGYVVTTDRMNFGTLHAEFKRALNALGVNTPIGSADVISKCLKSAIDSLGICRSDGHNLSREDYIAIESIVTYYRNRLGASKYQHPGCEEYSLYPDILDRLVQLFAQERGYAGVMDFEDLQELLYKYLYVTPNKAVQDFIANRYKYIYLDEFQDTSEIQYAIIKFYARGRLAINGSETPTDSACDGLYTGQKTKGKIIAIGDDDQCLVKGTPIVTKEGIKSIEDVVTGDEVLSGVGGSKAEFCRVESVSKKHFAGDTYKVITESGKTITGTANHICFARIADYENCVFLTYNLEDGFNISLEPNADRVWLLQKCDTFEEACECFEQYISEYNMDVTSSSVVRASGASKLINDEGFMVKHAHAVGTYLTDGVDVLKMFGDGDKTSLCCLSMKNGVISEKLKYTGSVDAMFNCIKYDNTILDYTYVHCVAKFNDNEYAFTPISALKCGMYVPVTTETGEVVEEKVVSVEKLRFAGEVYDINVMDAHNYTAGGIVVHNCIYSWRGSAIEVMCEHFPNDFKPTILNISRNYRCPSNILEPVITSIEENSKRYPKKLKASREGGIFAAYHFSSITSMLDNLRSQIDEDIANGRSVAIICRTNFDGVIPAFLLEMDHKYRFSVSSDAMTLSSPLPRNILNVCRLFMSGYSQYIKTTLEMLVDYKERFSVKQLCDKLKSDASIGVKSSIWTLDEDDLYYTCPEIFDLIKKLKRYLYDSSGNKIKGGGITALKFLYFHMLANVFDGDSSYCLRVRAYIEAVLYLLNSKNFETVYEFLDEVTEYSDRLKARVKKKDVDISIVTVHEFKGKERDSVYVWHDSEKFFPASKTDLCNSIQVEEERRVHYIACTRAREKCVVYALRGSHGMFLDEMDCEVSDPTQISGTLDKKDEINISDSCSLEEVKLKETLDSMSDDTPTDVSSDDGNVSMGLPDVKNEA